MQPTTVPAFLGSDGPRALFITNECAGLGHLRRTINLARAVTDATALIVTGSAALGSFVLPQRVDTVKLPVFRRQADVLPQRATTSPFRSAGTSRRAAVGAPVRRPTTTSGSW